MQSNNNKTQILSIVTIIMASIAHKETAKPEYSNNQVYDFLVAECKLRPSVWNIYGDSLTSHRTNAEFWESLGEKLDCFRVCSECGKPMIEGYVVDGCDTYCSEECLHKHITEEEFNELYDEGKGDTYWTTWYEDSVTYRYNK